MTKVEVDRERVAEEAHTTLEIARGMTDQFVDFLSSLALVESPTNHPETIADVHAILGPELQDLGFDVRVITGRVSGDHLYARPKRRARATPSQLLVGHTDTVWPLETLERMPVKVVDGR